MLLSIHVHELLYYLYLTFLIFFLILFLPLNCIYRFIAPFILFFSAVNKDCENIEGIEYVTTNQNEALKEKNKIKGAINRYIHLI